MEYDQDEVDRFKAFLRSVRDDGRYDYGEFDIADGVTVWCDWSQESDEWDLSINVSIGGAGFDLFTRGRGDTLAETGSYGHGPNNGDEIAADIGGWVAKNFTDEFDEIVFETHERQSDGDHWLFTAWVPNPNASPE